MAISAAFIAGTIPAYAAHTTSTFDEATRTYFYTNTYDSSIEKGNLGFDVSSAADPLDSTNKVMLIKDPDGKGGAQKDYNIISLSGLANGWASTPTYTTKGIDQNKLLVAETDIYLPTGLLDELASFAIGMPAYTQIWNFGLIGTIDVTKENDTGFLFTTGSNTKSIAADSWYNIKYTYNITTGAYKSYIDGELFASGKGDSWALPGMDAPFMGIKIKSQGNKITAEDGTVSYEPPITTGFYIDNSVIYQYADQTVSYSIEDGAVDVSLSVPIKVTFGCSVDAEKLTGLFEAVAADGSKVTGNVSQAGANSVNVYFDGLQGSTAYTLSFAGYSEGEIVLTAGSVAFTTEESARVDEKTILFDGNYDDTAVIHKYGSAAAVTQVSAADTGRSGKVLKYTSTGAAGVSYRQNYSIVNLSPNATWVNNTYESFRMTDDKMFFAEAEFYMPAALLKELPDTGHYKINLGTYACDDIVGNGLITVTKGTETGTFKLDFGDSVIASVNADTWFKIKYVGYPGGQLKVYLNDTVYREFSSGCVTAATKANGIRLFTPQGTAVTQGIFIDNVLIYQINTLIGIDNVLYNAEEGTVSVDLATSIVPAAINSIKLMLNGNDVSAVIKERKLKKNAHVAVLTVDSQAMVPSSLYNVVIPAGFTDINGQFTKEDCSASFQTGEGPRVDEKSYMFSYDMESAPYPITGKAWLSDAVIERIADPSGRSGYVMKYTTEGNLNETNNARGYTSRAGFSPNGAYYTKKYSEFGMTDDKTLFASADFYLPKAALDELTSDGWYNFCLGAVGIDDRYGFGNLTVKKSEDGASFTVSSKNQTAEIAPDTWFTVSYVYQPGSYDVKIYINNQLFDDIKGENNWFKLTSATAASGIRIVTPQGTVITDGIYIDNISIWQMTNKIGIDSVEFDGQNQKVKVNFATSINESELSKVQMMFNGKDVTSLITARELADNAYEATLTVDYSSMALSSDYSIELPTGFADINGQISMETASAVFTTPKSRNVYVKSYTLTAPTSTGASANVILDTVKAEAESAWVVMAVYGNYNELIAIDDKAVTADGETPVDLSVSSDCSAAKEVRIYVWNSPDEMVPLQKNELVWTAVE